MPTTASDIRQWYVQGVTDKKAYLVVWCDTFDYDDYPAYYDDRKSAQEALDKPSSMQRAMECYQLHEDRSLREAQLSKMRCWDLR